MYFIYHAIKFASTLDKYVAVSFPFIN